MAHNSSLNTIHSLYPSDACIIVGYSFIILAVGEHQIWVCQTGFALRTHFIIHGNYHIYKHTQIHTHKLSLYIYMYLTITFILTHSIKRLNYSWLSTYILTNNFLFILKHLCFTPLSLSLFLSSFPSLSLQFAESLCIISPSHYANMQFQMSAPCILELLSLLTDV